MGLYLAIFEDEDELDGVEVGGYSDFSIFRNAVGKNLEQDQAGSRFPVLMLHSDCDGQWTMKEAGRLEKELAVIRNELQGLPPVRLSEGWQREVATMFSIRPASLLECFFDIDGEPLVDRLIGLARLSQTVSLPILFQ